MNELTDDGFAKLKKNPHHARTGLVVMKPNYDEFFKAYIEVYNRAILGDLNTRAIRDFFSKKFLAAGPNSVATGRNGFFFTLVLRHGYRFYRKIGTKRLTLIRTTITEIDDHHDMAKVFYRADYEKKDGQATSIDFDVTYLLEHQGSKPRIFAFVAGDEMKTYRDAGLI